MSATLYRLNLSFCCLELYKQIVRIANAKKSYKKLSLRKAPALHKVYTCVLLLVMEKPKPTENCIHSKQRKKLLGISKIRGTNT